MTSDWQQLPPDPEQALQAYDPRAGHGPWTAEQAAHLLRRAVGGPRPGELTRVVEAGPAATLERLFAAPDEDDRRQALELAGRLARTGSLSLLQGWWLLQLAQESSACGSRLALFWHGHFACAHTKVDDLGALLSQHALFLERGAGAFPVLARGLLRDPALLRFLDADRNRRGQPNENLARELLELFTLGVGHYTERDVSEGARALTGYTVGPDGFRFVLEHHDREVKQVLGRWIDHGEDLVDTAVAQPACAPFLIRRLWSFYVAPEAPGPVVELLAERWRAQDLDLSWLLRTLLSSRAFFAASSRRSLVASPVDLVVGLARRLGARLDFGDAAAWCERMGQRLFDPPGVQGWAGGEAWIHAAAWLERMQFAARLARGQLDGAARAVADSLAVRPGESPDVHLDRLCELLLQGTLAEERRRALLASLPDDQPGPSTILAVLGLPEVHLT